MRHIARDCPKPQKERHFRGRERGIAQGRGRGASQGRGRGASDGERGRGRGYSTNHFNKAFAAALAHLDEDASSVEDDTKYLASNATAELKYSDTESVESSDSTELNTRAARMN